MRALLKKFLFELKEWFADMWDYINLAFIENKIYSLNEKLVGEANPIKRHTILIVTDMWSKSYNEVSRRIKDREIRHKRMVVH